MNSRGEDVGKGLFDTLNYIVMVDDYYNGNSLCRISMLKEYEWSEI